MPIFSQSEMEGRFALLQRGLSNRNIDVVFLHTADNVYYISGVPLLSEWGRPMWAVAEKDGGKTVIGAMIEKENMESYSWIKDVRVYSDDANVWQASISIVSDFLKTKARACKRIGIEKGLLPLSVFTELQSAFPETEFIEIGDLLAGMRIIKSGEELHLLRIGAELAKIGANAFLDALTVNTTELAVAAHAVAEMNKALAALYPEGATSSYSYCQVGDHTLTPHLHPTGRRIKVGDLVALNVFPVIWGYCMELERTYVFGEPDTAQEKALSAVNEAFEEAKAAMGPGVKMSEIDKLTREILSRHGYGEYIRHGTGHAHGIMVGAAGREELGELRVYNSNVLKPDMINSVEPGIYIPDLGGFRHSDVMVITENDATCLTDFPTTLN
jgi:Xaa-Pro aminopeptidase